MVFYLGIPKDKRSKIYYKTQYPPHPEQIEIFRLLIEPLIKGGVYERTNSLHNNPVLLVPKKNGSYRIVVDNRLVNADCEPVGAMSASPLNIIRMLDGAVIFTTHDLKNAFYCLLLAAEDRPFTAITLTGIGRLQSTRMQMGSKASMAALYQAMLDTLGDALYRYALV